MHDVVVYRGSGDGLLWVRPVEEFTDGRFEPFKLDDVEKSKSSKRKHGWLDPNSAPRDGTMLLLKVRKKPGDEEVYASFYDDEEPYVTLGFNNQLNTGEADWQFVGWDWSHDCFTDGKGEVIGWARFPELQPKPPVSEKPQADVERERNERLSISPIKD